MGPMSVKQCKIRSIPVIKNTINMVASVNVNVMIVQTFVRHEGKLGALGLDLPSPPLIS